MGKSFYLLTFLLVFTCLGCGQDRFNWANTIVSSQCTKTAAALNKTSNLLASTATPVTSGLSASQIQTACTSALNYVCTTRIFSPAVTDGKTTSKQCTTLSQLGQACLTVETLTYGTKQLMSQPNTDPKRFLPGGDLNTTTVTCANTATGVNPAKIVADGASLDGALGLALANCLNIKPAVTP